MDVNAESSPLPPANRDGGIDQDWAGDDQDWWDWYVTLAENDDAPLALVAGPGLPDVDPADDEQLRVELAAPYRLYAAQREAFRRDAFIKLAHVLSPAVVRLAERLDSLLRAEHGAAPTPPASASSSVAASPAPVAAPSAPVPPQPGQGGEHCRAGPVRPRPGVLPLSTETSWRRIRISASFAAAERASSAIHPARRTNIRYSSRTITSQRSCQPSHHHRWRTRRAAYLCPVLEPHWLA